MFLCLGLLNIVELIEPIPLHDMMVGFDLNFMISNQILSKRDPKDMHLVLKHVRRPNNKAIPQLHEVLCIESHLGV